MAWHTGYEKVSDSLAKYCFVTNMKVYLHCEHIRIGFCINMFFSVRVDEDSDLVYDKINRRLEHLTSLKTNSRKRESEDMLVISIYSPFTDHLWNSFYILTLYT